MTTTDSIQQLCINTMRKLSAHAVQKADSGYPGTPRGYYSGEPCFMAVNHEL